jgi:4'-phosphopantetheinyl transferase
MSQEWLVTDRAVTLVAGSIDLYATTVAEHLDRLDLFFASLSEDEQERAKRFRYPRDYNQFVVARGLLRRLLGQYLRCEPKDVAFVYGPHGKPMVESWKFNLGFELAFNLAHSGGWVLYGVSGDRAVGVDIEQMQGMETDLDRLSRRSFTKSEAQLVKSLAEPLKSEMFFRLWSCREAYLKATGEGLGKMKQMEVKAAVGQAAQLVNPQGWDLQELQLSEDMVGAVCAMGVDWRSRFWRMGAGF